MTRAIQKYHFYLFWTSISNVMAIQMQFDHNVTQAENLLFPYLKSNVHYILGKVTKFRGSADSLTEVIKKTI